MPNIRTNRRLQRSFLFVPGDRAERFSKAMNSASHAVILDLEDGVASDHKGLARLAVHDFLTQQPNCIVRLNGPDSEWFEADLAMLRKTRPSAIMLPKAESPDTIATVTSTIGSPVAVIALIETALGLSNCRELLRLEQVERLAFGSVDFMFDLGISDEQEGLQFARSELVLASRLRSRPAPIDGVTLAIDSESSLAADVARARRLGFGGKLCIHPRQAPIVNAGFLPDSTELAWARRVVSAWQNTPDGAFRLDGKLIDRPLIEKARQLLDSDLPDDVQ